jgi:hypothetical protein
MIATLTLLIVNLFISIVMGVMGTGVIKWEIFNERAFLTNLPHYK